MCNIGELGTVTTMNCYYTNGVTKLLLLTLQILFMLNGHKCGILLCPGGQYTLVCSTNHIFLVWSVTTTSQPSLHEMRTIPSSDQSPAITPIRVNTASIMFSKDSSPMVLPLVSTMTTENVNSYLEGTVITCTGQNSSSVSSVVFMTTIHINSDAPNPPVIAIKSNRTHFENSSFTVTLEWSQFGGETYTVATVPQPVHKNYTPGSTNIQLVMRYNTLYNVTVTATLCGHRNATNFTTIHNSKCDLPTRAFRDESVVISVNTEGPLIGGSTISYSCSTGQTISGSNTSICTDNGHWEPDPMDTSCSAICVPPSIPRNGYIYPYPNISSRVIIVCYGSDKIYVSDCHPNGKWQPNPASVCDTNETRQATCVPPSSPRNGYIYPYPNISSRVIILCTGSDRIYTSNCHPNGMWQPNPGDICDTEEKSHDQDTKPTLSVSTTAIISSLSSSFVFFIIGLLCGQITRLFPKRNKQPHPSETLQLHYEVVPHNISNSQEEHKAVNLQPNEAYGQLRGARIT